MKNHFYHFPPLQTEQTLIRQLLWELPDLGLLCLQRCRKAYIWRKGLKGYKSGFSIALHYHILMLWISPKITNKQITSFIKLLTNIGKDWPMIIQSAVVVQVISYLVHNMASPTVYINALNSLHQMRNIHV